MAIRRINGWHIFDGVTPLSVYRVVNQPWKVSYLLGKLAKKISHLHLMFNLSLSRM